jgi:heme/copper-type cytochrome/quinol oxidase subunit 2
VISVTDPSGRILGFIIITITIVIIVILITIVIIIIITRYYRYENDRVKRMRSTAIYEQMYC